MKRGLRLVGTAMTGAAMLFWFASSAVGEAAHAMPPYFKQGAAPSTAATQPSTIALLGAGLVALGVYARRKNHKKP
jgi:LPXTG-motif cell wall-anchored protein